MTGYLIARNTTGPTNHPRKENRFHALNLNVLSRYYEHAHGGNDYISRYMVARDATGSTDHLLKQNRFYTLYQVVLNVLRRRLVGAVAECGCWLGHSTHLMAGLLADRAWSGRLWVFDSFEGLSEATEKDRTQRGDTEVATSVRKELKHSSNLRSVQRALARFPFVSLHKGWIPEVFGTALIPREQKFALVHIDVDLYQPTIDSLRFFYPRMADGGVIVVDDYGSTTFPGAKAAVDEFMEEVEVAWFLESHLQGAVLVV